MATFVSPRPSPPGSRHSPSISTSPPPTGVIARGATARSAVPPPRVPSALRSPTYGSFPSSPTSPVTGHETREELADSLMRESDEKEQLLVQLQNKEQAAVELTEENDYLSSALNTAEGRLTEMYMEQTRQEEETAARLEVMEKLRVQARELEREKRELQRRYNEQTSTFEAERQAFYDNEQHLKSRIQSLSASLFQARKQHQPEPSILSEAESETEVEEEEAVNVDGKVDAPEPLEAVQDEPAEVTALKLEMSTLSTSYASMQSTLVLLQTQLVDLKRVNRELQEENESYMILLREKTLNGQFDLGRSLGGGSSSDGDQADDDDDELASEDLTDHGSTQSNARQPLAPVEEHEHEYEHDYERELANELSRAEAEAEQETRGGSRHRKQSTISDDDDEPQGESLAGLPLTGPGLDLAAELGRAENKDILDGSVLPGDEKPPQTPRKRGRKTSITVSAAGVLEVKSKAHDIEALRNEVKSLKDANKALSLYASRIIDRIIAQEGFEHVLAVDYAEKTPTSAAAKGTFPPPVPPKSPGVGEKKTRPQTTFFGRPLNTSTMAFPSDPSAPPPTPTANSTSPPRPNRRSLSFDWRSFSVFGGGDKKPEPPHRSLKPLTLGSGSAVTGARKLDTFEDDEDRRERERLNATMKLMGIDKPASPPPPMVKSVSTPEGSRPTVQRENSLPSRWSLFGRSRSMTTSEVSSTNNSRSGSPKPGPLTHEALEHAQAQEKLAALDAHERTLSMEIAQGASGGFTEIAPRRSRGGGRGSARSGSGSTVWSAGMSKGHDSDE